MMLKPLDRWPRAILRRTAIAHGMTISDLESASRSARLAAARRDGARALHDEGYSITLISRVLKKNPVTVLEYLSEDMRLRRNAERKLLLRRMRAAPGYVRPHA